MSENTKYIFNNELNINIQFMDNSLKKIISKMSKCEKEFFSSFSFFNNTFSNNYNILYNHIIKYGNIQINELKKEIKDNVFIKYISIKKEVLLENILQSLVNHHFEDNIHWKIQRDILYIKILIEKDLIEKAKKIINRAKSNAYRFEEFSLLINLLELEESLCFIHNFITDINKLNEIKKERKTIIDINENLKDLLKIKAELQHFQFNEDTYTSDLNNFIKTFGYNPTSPEFEPKSIKAQFIWLYIQGISNYIQLDYSTSLIVTTKQYKLYHKHSDLFLRFEYLQLMVNYLYCCCLTQNENLFNQLMIEYKSLPNKTKEEEIFIITSSYCRTLELYHRISKFKEAELIAIEAEQYFEKVKLLLEHINNNLIHFNIIRAYIDNSNYIAAIKSLKKRIRTIGFDYYGSLFKIFEFISHYKLGNFEYLLFAVNSWAKTIRSKRKQFPIEKILIKYFRIVSNIIDKEKKLQLLTKLTIQIKEIESSKLKYFIHHNFNFAAWFERELEEMK